MENQTLLRLFVWTETLLAVKLCFPAQSSTISARNISCDLVRMMGTHFPDQWGEMSLGVHGGVSTAITHPFLSRLHGHASLPGKGEGEDHLYLRWSPTSRDDGLQKRHWELAMKKEAPVRMKWYCSTVTTRRPFSGFPVRQLHKHAFTGVQTPQQTLPAQNADVCSQPPLRCLSHVVD